MNPIGKTMKRFFRFGDGPAADPGAVRPEQKTSAVGKLLGSGRETAWIGLPAPNWTGRSYEQLVREGYRKNVIANRSVRIVAESASAVPLVLYRGGERITRHPLLDLLSGPNPLQSGNELTEALFSFLQIAGNAYLEIVDDARGDPAELYILRPDRMKIVPGPSGWPARFEYKVAGRTHAFPVDARSGQSPIVHFRTFHPLDDFYGLTLLEACAFGIDIHNSAQSWNKSLLDNAARPSGALVFEPGEGRPGTLSEEQFTRLKEELEEQHQGAANAGRPFLLEGGLKWQQIAFSPSDMEFIQSKHVSAREIALAFGVPPMLLGIPGDNTYSNYQEANRALWRLTLLPLLQKTVATLNAFLTSRFGDDLRLDFDRDAVPALQFEREALWKRVGGAAFLTTNEKRQALGFEPIPGGDTLPGAVPEQAE